MSNTLSYLETIASKPTVWISTEGPRSSTVISSRIRLARNLSGHRFCQRAKPDEMDNVAQTIIEASNNIKRFQHAETIRLEQTSLVDRQMLLERHLISQEHAKGGKGRIVIIDKNETNGMMINEEDHIRLQCILPGFALKDAWTLINDIDDQLDKLVVYAFMPEWGYLTACPTNVGTGIRASVMLHVPALTITKQIDGILQKASQAGLAVRGLYGEGSESVGDLFQFSNQITLGQNENELINIIDVYVNQIIAKEENCRKQLLKEAKSKVEDVVFRAFGVLTNARMISTREAMKLLSHLRLGVNYGWFDLSYAKLNELMLLIQPAHIQKSSRKELDDTQRDMIRAEMIRSNLTQ